MRGQSQAQCSPVKYTTDTWTSTLREAEPPHSGRRINAATRPGARRLSLRAFLLAGMAASVAGCGTVGSVVSVVASDTANAFDRPAAPTYLNWKGLMVLADADTNQNSAIALDIVFVRDQPTLDKLSSISAARWFATRMEQLGTYPDALSVRSLELVPGQRLVLPESELGSPRVAGVLLFANYRAPGEHRVRLPAVRNGGLVRLGARDFTVTEHPL
jgi:type VI secretion system protein